jgi:ABC-type antimicrobial peptide transport system permease subunit
VSGGLLSTPRPVPGRRIPTVASAAVVLLALPVVAIGGFSFAGWALAAALWAAAEAISYFLGRMPTGADALKSSAFVGVATAFRGIGVMVVLLAVTVADRHVGVVAAIVYVLAYSLSLGLSLLEYFSGERLG